MRNSCTFKLARPVTFRRASSKILPEGSKKNIGYGSNMQNIEGSLREVYMPDGFSPSLEEKCLYWLEKWDLSIFTPEELEYLQCFLQTDQSGAEGVIVAYDSEPKDYRQLFIHGISPHVYVAMKLFAEVWKKKIKELNVQVDEKCIDELYYTPIGQLKQHPSWHEVNLLIKSSDNWPTNERYYYFAKQTVHSFSYGIQWHTFIMNVLEKSGGKVVIPPDDGKQYLMEIRGLFPEVPERCSRIDDQVKATGIIYNIHGQPYIIWPGGVPPERLLSDMKKFYAWGAQSGVAGITQKALTGLQEYIESKNKKWDILTETHDSYLTQGRLHDVKERKEKMEEFIGQQEFTSAIDGVKFRMKSETKVAFNWGNKSEKNKLGMRAFKI